MSKEKHLIVKGCAGLGNRLYTACSAIEYAKKTNRILSIDWSDGQFAPKGTNAFDLFFKIKGVNTITDIKNINDLNLKIHYPNIWKQKPNEGVYDLYLHCSYPLFYKIPYSFLKTERLKMLHGFWMEIYNDQQKVPATATGFIKAILNKKNIAPGSAYSLNHPEEILYYIDFAPTFDQNTFTNHIELNDTIRKKIIRLQTDLGITNNTIGVHVRSTDKKPKNSLTKLFEKLDELNWETIFLATDNQLVINSFEQKYPNKTITQKKLLPDTGKDGLHQWALYNKQEDKMIQLFEESIMDMWLLGSCGSLVYQSNSSFSGISKLLMKNKKQIYAW